MKIILASTSPRRKELLKKIFDEFAAIGADVDEPAVERSVESAGGYTDEADLAEKTVRALSRAKAMAVLRMCESGAAGECNATGEDHAAGDEGLLVIGADTVVALSNEILGKPKNRDDAVRMLRAQSAEPQQVFTGVTLVHRPAGGDAVIRTFTEKTVVFFYPLGPEQEARIQAYCDTKEPYDKAGAYGIQGMGRSLVEHYEGDFSNIMGFPVDRVREEILAMLGGCALCSKDMAGCGQWQGCGACCQGVQHNI